MIKYIDTKGLNGRLKIVFLLLCILLTCYSCKDTGIEVISTTQLKVEDVSVTEVWLRVSMSDGSADIPIKQNDSLLTTLHSPVDTVLYYAGLLPKHTYTYKAGKGTTLAVTTMDTTSHNFTWQIDTLGDGMNSSLYDVAIINDTLAYAVGEIYKKDLTGQMETSSYGLAKWNGQNWKLEKVRYKAFPTATQRNPGPLNAIFAFGPDKIIATQGSLVMWYDGVSWSEEQFLYDHFTDTSSGGINKFWGISPSQLWAVGNKGTIFHYNGTSWSKIESGTTLNIQDIWGSYNTKTASYEILAVASHSGATYDRKILQITGTTASSISDYPIAYPVASVWFVPNRRYYVVGDGIYEKHTLADSSWKNNPLDFTPYYTTKVYGNALNDVFFVGSYGDCLHYNGISYKSYINSGTRLNGVYSAVRTLNNLVIAVGYVDSKACVLMGRR